MQRFPTLPRIRREYLRRHKKEKISTTTGLRDIRKHPEYRGNLARRKVVNNDRGKNKIRLKAAKRFVKLNPRRLAFCDECWVNNDNTHRKEFVLGAKSKPSPRVFSKRPSVKLRIWAAIGFNVKSDLVFCEKSITANVYQETHLPVAKTLLDDLHRATKKKVFFVHDNARPHSARTAQKWLQDNAYSPHLNPIEHVWAEFHVRVSQLYFGKRPQKWKKKKFDQTFLKDCAIKAWASFTQEQINAYVLGFKSSAQRQIDEKGALW